MYNVLLAKLNLVYESISLPTVPGNHQYSITTNHLQSNGAALWCQSPSFNFREASTNLSTKLKEHTLTWISRWMLSLQNYKIKGTVSNFQDYKTRNLYKYHQMVPIWTCKVKKWPKKLDLMKCVWKYSKHQHTNVGELLLLSGNVKESLCILIPSNCSRQPSKYIA